MDILGFFQQRKQRLIELAEQRRQTRKTSGRIRIKSHIDAVLDAHSARRLFTDITGADPLGFPGYAKKAADLTRRTGLPDAFICASGRIEGHPVICVELVGEFLMGSMGTAVGEAVCRGIELATERRLPLIIFSASGGARMQEGLFSLMQMAKTAAACRRLSRAGGLFISVLCHPTTGGVSASFASLGDITIAEPDALIGFAGPRVIEQTIGAKLPEGFQRAEFQRAHGFVDLIVARPQQRAVLAQLLALHAVEEDVAHAFASRPAPRAAAAPPTPSTRLSPTEHVAIARNPARPHIRAFINGLFDDFVELHGDRLFADDRALIGGIARFEGLPITIAGHQKGADLNENIACNFGMPHPEGYRKFLRLARAAEKFSRPLVTFIDTPGAHPGAQAEERGQAEAIARCLFELSDLQIPVIAIITGEGGSGGALALGLADKILMYQYATYSILSPEGFASILWKDANRSAEAASVMRLTAPDLLSAGMVDQIIAEPPGGAHLNATAAIAALRVPLRSALTQCSAKATADLLTERYQRFRGY
ncbi:MAG: acetyl-CoA carboxylase carboxyltransferase subunit alpha [Coriobacteriales bacterium]|jgi:acetyl-CoA carboxylase carboxyl transferase subunit beta|nr:acetyl-CoA carboxylase carboxyltransferase subunit alpha [Coriobacteriales bacterium]